MKAAPVVELTKISGLIKALDCKPDMFLGNMVVLDASKAEEIKKILLAAERFLNAEKILNYYKGQEVLYPELTIQEEEGLLTPLQKETIRASMCAVSAQAELEDLIKL